MRLTTADVGLSNSRRVNTLLRKQILRWLLVASFTIASLTQVRANEIESEQDAPVETEENVIVTIASRDDQALSDLPMSISVISASELQSINHSHIQEAINRIPGVNFHRGNGQEYLPAIRSQVFTGAGGCGALLILEGNIPVRPAGFCNINELFEANTELASQIEVIRGPGTVYYGSNALHGVINIITPPAEQGGRIALEVGENDHYRTTFKTGHESDDHRVGLAFIGASYGGWREESFYDQQKLALRHEYSGDGFSIRSGLSTTNLNQETSGYVTGEDSYRDLSISRMNQDPEGYRDVQSLRLWSRIAIDHNVDSRLIITPYLRSSDMNFMMHFLPGDPVEENGQTSFGIQSNYETYFNESLRLRTGFDIEYADTFLRQTQQNPTPGSAFLQATIPAGKQYDYEVDSRLISGFADLHKEYSRRFSVGAGLRFEQLEYDYTNLMNSGRLTEDGQTCGFGGCRYSRPESAVDTFDNWSIDLNMNYLATSDTALFSRLSRAFRAPQATELYRLQRAQTIADLDSESVTAFEVGYQARQDVLRYQVSLYWMTKKNFIFRDADFFNVSDGETSHHGIELALNYSLGENWYFGLSSSYARHRYAYDSIQNGININGKDIDSAPRLTANSRLGWQNNATRIEFEWIHADDYYLEPTNQFSYAGHDLVHLVASHQLSNSLELKARVHNLLDKRYAERADYTSFTAYRYFPGTPRQISLILSYMW